MMNFNQQKIVHVCGFEGGTFKDEGGAQREWGRIYIGQSLNGEGTGGFTVMKASADKPVLDLLRTVKDFPVVVQAEISQRAGEGGTVKERYITAKLLKAG